ncbi:MAG: 3-deoxy-7-phosphoheptulonate synthase [Blastocatellia bacterium]|jgi:3-deoxy-7-phosphoheptulonate synthase|nr:3-deoxy-7-phosphoheptulonate synthase [Blastocatellia bacterium]
MLVVMKAGATQQQIDAVCKAIENLGFEPQLMPGPTRTAIGITGNDDAVDSSHFEPLPGVERAIPVTQPYKLVTLTGHPDKTVVRVGDALIGDDELAIIAGPCAIESRDQAFTIAEAVKRSGARFFRGGAFKPRTSPYAFQGLGEEALKIMAEIRDAYGLRIVTEAIDEPTVDMVERYADVIQIGARSMQNFSLLKRAGRSQLPVLLKRGLSATLDEWLLAAEYIMAEGNHRVVLCERGVRTFAQHTRNTMDLAAIPAVRRISHLPVIVDPSHGTGKNYMVTPLARAGVAVGADGLMVEVHDHPELALSDGPQALTLDQYQALVDEVRAIHEVITPAPVG